MAIQSQIVCSFCRSPLLEEVSGYIFPCLHSFHKICHDDFTYCLTCYYQSDDALCSLAFIQLTVLHFEHCIVWTRRVNSRCLPRVSLVNSRLPITIYMCSLLKKLGRKVARRNSNCLITTYNELKSRQKLLVRRTKDKQSKLRTHCVLNQKYSLVNSHEFQGHPMLSNYLSSYIRAAYNTDNIN